MDEFETDDDEGSDLDGIAEPHELLGIPAAERDPVQIVEAATVRLEALRQVRGGDPELRRIMAAFIRRARDQLLRTVCDGESSGAPA